MCACRVRRSLYGWNACTIIDSCVTIVAPWSCTRPSPDHPCSHRYKRDVASDCSNTFGTAVGHDCHCSRRRVLSRPHQNTDAREDSRHNPDHGRLLTRFPLKSPNYCFFEKIILHDKIIFFIQVFFYDLDYTSRFPENHFEHRILQHQKSPRVYFFAAGLSGSRRERVKEGAFNAYFLVVVWN